MSPETTLELLDDATQLLASGLPGQAASRCRAWLARHPEDPRALALLGKALHALARHADAEAVFLRLTELQPQEAMHWMNLGTARRCTGHPDDALLAFARAAALGAASADFYFNVALAHMQRDDFESARLVLETARALQPEDLEIRYNYAQCCFQRHRLGEAQAALENWEQNADPADPVIPDIGQLLLLLGEPVRAEQAVRLAAEVQNATAEARLRLVQFLERTNRVAEARVLLDRLLAETHSGEQLQELVLTQAHLYQREEQHELTSALFRKSLATRREFHSRHIDLYPLAKSLDALQRFDEAYDALLEAHRSQFAYLRRSAPLAALRGTPSMVIAEHGCDPDDVRSWNTAEGPPAAASPVFIVAFPRSGTTLLELALDAHPQLKSMDEQPFLHNALDDLVAAGARYPTELGRLSGSQLATVRDRYWQRVRAKVELAPGQRLVDKNPLNLLRLPVIKRLFPNAHVILAIRHPGDVLLSCFMQHFRAPEFALLCQNLPSLAAGFRKAFNFWYEQQTLLQAKVLELRYETFVTDFNAEARAAITFLELPWDDAVLAPGKRATEKGYVSTPSYSQVVRPISNRAVGRWQNYRQYFAEALPIVQPLINRWGYEN